MINLFNYFLEANLILLGFALIYYSLLAKQANFQFRRVFILFAVFCTLTVPFISVNFNEGVVSENLLSDGVATITLPEVVVGVSQDDEATTSWDLHWSFYLYFTYCLIIMVFFAKLAQQLLALYSILDEKDTKQSIQEAYTLIEAPSKYPTFSFFVTIQVSKASFKRYEDVLVQ